MTRLPSIGTAPRAFVLALLLAPLLWRCSAIPNPTKAEKLDDIPPEAIARLDAMPELSGGHASVVETLGEVDGVSCRREFFKGMPPSWEDAVRRTKYRALQRGADAIANLDCGKPQGTSLTTMCYESIRCTATAVRTRP